MPEEKDRVTIEGYGFSIVKQGLDESQVAQTIRKLITQLEACRRENFELKKREDHLVSLTKLAEKVVVEAD
ncbi:MAG: hypothetical protein WC231_04390, partial [Dehalococcoidales bacterium]